MIRRTLRRWLGIDERLADDVRRLRHEADYLELERLRRATAAMSLMERYEELKRLKGADAGGWFDAVSPLINDTYPFYEIQAWLRREGFVDIQRTVDQSSHCVIARRPS